MRGKNFRIILIISYLFLHPDLYAETHKLMRLDIPVSKWLVHNGSPIAFQSTEHAYHVSNHISDYLFSMENLSSMASSPSGEFLLLVSHEPLKSEEQSKLISDYVILNSTGKLIYRISVESSRDGKRFEVALSDNGVLAVIDPMNAYLKLYKNGAEISQGLLFKREDDTSLERNIRLCWMDEKCYAILERPGINGGVPGNALFIRFDEAGENQLIAHLPFAYLQEIVVQAGKIFVSGYNYDPGTDSMEPMILELDSEGNILWSYAYFGHELALSVNGRYLASLKSHEEIEVFDLETKRIRHLNFSHENQALKGIAVNNEGRVATLRMPLDFFVSHTSQQVTVFFPDTQHETFISLDPTKPQLFKIYSDGVGYYLGTSHEWLEIK